MLVVERLTTSWQMFMSTSNPYRLNSDEKTLADSLDYEKEESRKLREEKKDLLKKLQEANSATQKLQGEVNSKCWTWNCLCHFDLYLFNSCFFSEQETDMRRLQNEVKDKSLVINEISRITKDKDQEIERLKSRRAGKQIFTCSPLRVLSLF